MLPALNLNCSCIYEDAVNKASSYSAEIFAKQIMGSEKGAANVVEYLNYGVSMDHGTLSSSGLCDFGPFNNNIQRVDPLIPMGV